MSEEFKSICFTLHLTDRCNLRCEYCNSHCADQGGGEVMASETAFKVLDMCSEYDSVGIVFFGGEPLLCKDLIRDIIEYAKGIDCIFHFKMTTNGLLLDAETLDFCKNNKIMVSLSLDGVQQAHDLHRKDVLGNSTYPVVVETAKRLLKAMPYSFVMLTLNPDIVPFYAESVKHLFDLGFRYLICTLNYQADWKERDLKSLKAEYQKLAKIYLNWTLAEEKFYFSPFEVKIMSHIMGGESCKERCQLGLRQISVSPSGRLYPCIQFVNMDDFLMGNVDTGIDQEAQSKLFERSAENAEICIDCAIRQRCNHNCGCINIATTGDINGIAPIVCRHEQMVLPIADRLAEKLYKKRSGMFIQKQYNEMYPLISLVEDAVGGEKDEIEKGRNN